MVSTPSTPASGSLRETAGRVVGWLWSPVIAAVAAARHARMFHPDGIVVAARVEPSTPSAASTDAVRRVGDRLAGAALIRFSSALWKGEGEHLDALGLAVRFGACSEATLADGDQDLLFATIRSPLTMLLAPFTTDTHDFLRNTYFAVAPFDVEGVGRVKLRLVPDKAARAVGKSRREKLRGAIESSTTLLLELRPTWRTGWVPVARVVLEAELDLNQDALRFDPLRAGRGIVPRGFVHALRRGAYAASQAARPKS